MNIKILQCLAFLALWTAGAEAAPNLVEPRLVLPLQHHAVPRVALTLDACTGAADQRILGALIENRIPATVFVTARWLKRNGPVVKEMLAHPDLFEIENHGARHLPAVDVPVTVYGLAAAGSPAAVKQEVLQGAAAITVTTGRPPRWFRGATGKYSPAAITGIEALGERVAGYSIIADAGATLGATRTARNIAAARAGDVIIAHLNQPAKPAGAGVVAGILALKAKGFVFVRLEDAGFSR
jgi:peptidoglycan/xylan/chitin deacetylase (PgdA/CDA1 family)